MFQLSPIKMKNQFISILLFLFIPFDWLAYANTQIPVITVPFENFSLLPNAIVKANYSFGDHPMIFCFDNTLQTQGRIQWPYHGQIKSSSLPIFLKDNSNFDGQFADLNGVIKITNTTSATLIVNCQFGF
jgi:hypothetical protein